MNTDATTNIEEYCWLMWHAHAHDISDLPTLIRVSVINFVIVHMVQLTV